MKKGRHQSYCLCGPTNIPKAKKYSIYNNIKKKKKEKGQLKS